MSLPTALSGGIPGFYRLRGPVDLTALRPVYGERLVVADCSGVISKGGLFEAMGAGFVFPGYASANWDALLDLLRDLEWLGEGPRCLLFANTSALAKAEPATFRTLTEVLRDAATFWARQPDNATAFVLELPGDTPA